MGLAVDGGDRLEGHLSRGVIISAGWPLKSTETGVPEHHRVNFLVP